MDLRYSFTMKTMLGSIIIVASVACARDVSHTPVYAPPPGKELAMLPIIANSTKFRSCDGAALNLVTSADALDLLACTPCPNSDAGASTCPYGKPSETVRPAIDWQTHAVVAYWSDGNPVTGLTKDSDRIIVSTTDGCSGTPPMGDLHSLSLFLVPKVSMVTPHYSPTSCANVP